MKARNFRYVRPDSLAHACRILADAGGDAVPVAGGQSLLAGLNMRLSAPKLLVDIGDLAELAGQSASGGVVRLGALTRHHELIGSDLVRRHVPLLAQAAPQIGHMAIRNRGTLGGSLALADPAAEYPAVAVALQATIVISGAKGERRVKAEEFFKGLFETDLKQGEILTAAEFPTGGRSAFLELTRRHGDYAIIGLAAHEARFVFFNAGPTPVLARNASKEKTIEKAKEALKKDLDPPADLYNTSATKLHLAGVLLERAWNTLSTSR
jgi:carbon-monoxide dehydrogenase medium subunit